MLVFFHSTQRLFVPFFCVCITVSLFYELCVLNVSIYIAAVSHSTVLYCTVLYNGVGQSESNYVIRLLHICVGSHSGPHPNHRFALFSTVYFRRRPPIPRPSCVSQRFVEVSFQVNQSNLEKASTAYFDTNLWKLR